MSSMISTFDLKTSSRLVCEVRANSPKEENICSRQVMSKQTDRLIDKQGWMVMAILFLTKSISFKRDPYKDTGNIQTLYLNYLDFFLIS